MQSVHLVQLAAIGLLLALLPLASVWGAKSGARYRKLVAVTLFLTFDLIIFGAFTRLTDSGLGCPDWPGCYGQANPWQAHSAIAAAEAAMPDGPVTVMKAWIEMLHRYMAMAIGVLIIALVIGAWRLWKKTHQPEHHPLLPIALLFFVLLQGAFGAWTVTMKLQPAIVTGHLLLGMLLLCMLGWLYARQQASQTESTPQIQQRGLAWLAKAAFVLAFIQIALGGWVSTNYATLACMEYPLCQGAWIPEMDWQHGFSLWRELGKTRHGDFLPFPALTAIHWLHRNFALLVLLVAGYFAWRMRVRQANLARLLAAILTWQVLSGLATIYFAWPLAIALAHNAGAAALVLCLTVLNFRVSLGRGNLA